MLLDDVQHQMESVKCYLNFSIAKFGCLMRPYTLQIKKDTQMFSYKSAFFLLWVQNGSLFHYASIFEENNSKRLYRNSLLFTRFM